MRLEANSVHGSSNVTGKQTKLCATKLALKARGSFGTAFCGNSRMIALSNCANGSILIVAQQIPTNASPQPESGQMRRRVKTQAFPFFLANPARVVQSSALLNKI